MLIGEPVPAGERCAVVAYNHLLFTRLRPT